ncbi:hypothetical protein ACJX0J_040695, partial [Zea mays]
LGLPRKNVKLHRGCLLITFTRGLRGKKNLNNAKKEDIKERKKKTDTAAAIASFSQHFKQALNLDSPIYTGDLGLVWIQGKNGRFSVKSVYNTLLEMKPVYILNTFNFMEIICHAFKTSELTFTLVTNDKRVILMGTWEDDQDQRF